MVEQLDTQMTKKNTKQISRMFCVRSFIILVITFIWRRERLPTPVFWPGEFHGLYRPWGYKESRMSDFHFHFQLHL